MGVIDWLVGKHEEDLAVKALRRIKSGYPMPGDVQLAHKHFGDFGDRLEKPTKKAKR